LAVRDERHVLVERARILQVLADGAEAGGAPAPQQLALDEHLRAVADGGDELALLDRVLHEAHGLHVRAHLVRGHAAGDDDAVELFGERVGRRPVGLLRHLHVLALISLVDARAEHGHFRAGLLERVVGNLELAVLDVLLDEDGDPLRPVRRLVRRHRKTLLASLKESDDGRARARRALVFNERSLATVMPARARREGRQTARRARRRRPNPYRAAPLLSASVT
jgi:hypothetical protein